MIPELEANETVDLYRATSLPGGWKHETTLFRGRAADTTPLHHDGVWCFFTTLCEPLGNAAFGALFTAPSLTDNWTFHPVNPISTGVRNAQSAGPIYRDSDGRLLRPVQDVPGGRVHIHEIRTLTPMCPRKRGSDRSKPPIPYGILKCGRSDRRSTVREKGKLMNRVPQIIR